MKQSKPQPVTALIPGASAWELWQWTDGKAGRLLASADAPEELKPPRDAIVCMPVRETASAAIWLSTKDEAMVQEMAALQAEAVFQHDREEGVFGYHAIRGDDARTLVFAVNAPVDPPSLSGISLAAKCVPFLSAFEFEADTLTVFREFGALVAVVTSGVNPVGMLRLGSATFDATACAELKCFVLRLAAEGVVENIRRLVVWDIPVEDFGWKEVPFSKRDDEAAPLLAMGAVGGGEISRKSVPRPSPRIPGGEITLLLPRFVHALQREKQVKKLRAVSFAAGSVVAVFLLVFLAHYGWLEYECHSLAVGNAALRPRVERLQAEETKWRTLEPSVNPDLFAIEWLRQFASRLPPKGVRMTLFHLDTKGITVTGEADRAAQAVEYQEVLASAPYFAALHLSMPPPKILPDDVASFEINGSLKGGSGNEIP